MSKKIIKAEIIAEITVDSEWYGPISDDAILELEKTNWLEWISANVISEKLSIRDT